MLGLLLYIRPSGVLFDCPSAQCWRRRPAAPVRRNPGAAGPAGLNATWSASTYAFGRPPFSCSCRPSISTQQAHHFSLHADAIRPEDPRFVGWICSLERNRRAPLAQSLERRFLLVDQRDDNLARLRCVLLANDDGVVLEDAGLDHRIAAHLKGEVLAAA